LIKPIVIERLRSVVLRAVSAGRLARLKRQCSVATGGESFYVGDRAASEASLNSALASLWLAYQPMVRADDGSTSAYEALVRSDEAVLPHPAALLHAAETLQRVHELGRAVRARVARDANHPRLASTQLFVNLHPDDFLDETLFSRDAPLSRLASRIVLEVSDRASLEHVTDIQNRVARLRELGYRFAIDDLGAGQADPQTFTVLEPEIVKIDVSLVRGVESAPAKLEVVRSLSRLCRQMRKLVVAEGVESAPERDALREAGCHWLQGFLFGRPSALSSGAVSD
jgi:EAL domain-containing protein (putative c-di-GMP-specific phosphodiesterase class I)